jgi:nicotinate-nucleotide--dimethylbenzimidazole phosphoribosyltransferase
VLGEIGIGNTTVAAALAGLVLGGEPAAWVGRGTGVDDDGLARKQAAVAAVMQRASKLSDPIEVMRQAGGAELTAMAAATIAARLRSIPVVLDGYVVASAMLPLHAARPGALDHCIVGHCSAEPGHRRILETIAKAPLLDLGMRLGEGSGAMMAVPIIRAACDAVVDVATFSEWFADGTT